MSSAVSDERLVDDSQGAVEERLARLAREKSRLQFAVYVMDRIGTASSLEATVHDLLQVIVDAFGGSDAMLYYFSGDGVFRADVHGPL